MLNWLFILESHDTSWLTCRNHMPPPNLPNSPKEIKQIRAQWVALLIVEDGGFRSIFTKVTNSTIIKVIAKSTCITHPSNIGPLYH